MQPKPKTGSLKDLGLQRFMDERYYKYGGYVKLDAMFQEVEAGACSLAEVARQFSPADRPMSRQNPADWYRQWQDEKEAAE